MILFRNAATAALCFWFSASLACEARQAPCTPTWTPAPDREDLRTCNSTRIGDTAYQGDMKFEACMQSMGYREVCQ